MIQIGTKTQFGLVVGITFKALVRHCICMSAGYINEIPESLIIKMQKETKDV